MEEENKKESLESNGKGFSLKKENEDPSSEKTEELVKELLEEISPKEPSLEVSSKDKQRSRLIYGFLGFCLILLISLGLFTIWKIFSPLSKEPSKASGKVEDRAINETLKPLISKEEGRDNASNKPLKSISTLPPQERKFNLKLELKNFLLSLDERTYLKLDIFLYFENYADYKEALKEEIFLRDFIYHEIKTREATLWRREDKVKEYEGVLLEKLERRFPNIKFAKIEIEGLLLKV